MRSSLRACVALSCLGLINPSFAALSERSASLVPVSGAFTGAQALRAGTNDISKAVPPLLLDIRVGPNTRVGDDPAELSATQLSQAQPCLVRANVDSFTLAAAFLEGALNDGTALGVGAAASFDGGVTWKRILLSGLTQLKGGTYARAGGVSAAIGSQREFYFSALLSSSGRFDDGAILVSRIGTTGGTDPAPVVAYQAANTQSHPDQHRIAANDVATPNRGRVVVTWTNVSGPASGASAAGNLMATVSDDRAGTWSTPVAITTAGSTDLAAQPAFLYDGSLLVVYATLPSAGSATSFTLQCKRSTDGGKSFPATPTTIANGISAWDDPDLRDAVFTPSVSVSAFGPIFVTYTAIVNGTPRIVVTASRDEGETWSTPVAVSDNPVTVRVMSPAIAASRISNGTSVAVAYYQKSAAASDGHHDLDVYAAQSFDGGVTWQPPLRLTDRSSNVGYAPQTPQGFWAGDQLAVAPDLLKTGLAQPCVVIWCDPRTGESDPYTTRVVPRAIPGYTNLGDNAYAVWGLAQGSPYSPLADDDMDGHSNYLEYLEGTSAERAESSESLFVRRSAPDTVIVLWPERNDVVPLYTSGLRMVPLATYQQSGWGNAPFLDVNTNESPAATTLPVGFGWHGVRITVTAGIAYVVQRAVQFAPGNLPIPAGPEVTIGGESRLINVSSRGTVSAGNDQMIVGFVLDGSKSMLVRAAGPSLIPFGVGDALPATQFTLASQPPSTAVSVANTQWEQGTATSALFTRLGAFPFDAGSKDSAVWQTLPAGGYTAVISAPNGQTGSGLAEAYDADPSPGLPAGPRILNLSTRGVVSDGHPLIAGFVITGNSKRRVLIRAVGPSLSAVLPGTISDPLLSLYHPGAQTPFATNDDWMLNRSNAVIQATSARLGAFALDTKMADAVLLMTLAPGGYTATVSGVSGASGIALVEVYDAD